MIFSLKTAQIKKKDSRSGIQLFNDSDNAKSSQLVLSVHRGPGNIQPLHRNCPAAFIQHSFVPQQFVLCLLCTRHCPRH